MNPFPDTQALFAQLAALPAEGAVKTLIENHQSWTHNDAVVATLSPALRARLAALPRCPAAQSRIAAQRRSLAPLLTRLPTPFASAI